jgi:hypothetical protein
MAAGYADDPERDLELGLEIILDWLARSLDRAPPG